MLKLSVVVAAQDAGLLLKRCLAALVPQLPGEEMEIVVASAGASCRAELAREFPTVRLVSNPAPLNVPRLWSAGIAAAQGRIIALTIENCIPDPRWAARMIASHDSPWPAIGGAIEPFLEAGLTDWAVYFTRYSNSMLPFEPRFLDDLAADNCSYKRAALEAVQDAAREGFWETLVHEEMRRRQEKLFSDPSLIVTFAGGIGAFRFLSRRYHHGRYFAARRSAGFSAGQRLVRALGAPLVPLLLLRRMGGRIRRKRRYGAKFLVCLPLIVCFLLAWAAGEGIGYAAGDSAGGPAE